MVHSTYTSKSDKETQDIGLEFARGLKPGDTVLLHGDLGFGKTTFIKGVAKGLGIKSRIISPTFVVIRSHKFKIQKAKGKSTNQNSKVLQHIDLYRIENKKQLVEIGLEEILRNKNSIKLIEWAEKLDRLPKARWEIKLQMNKDNTRTINIYEYK